MAVEPFSASDGDSRPPLLGRRRPACPPRQRQCYWTQARSRRRSGRSCRPRWWVTALAVLSLRDRQVALDIFRGFLHERAASASTACLAATAATQNARPACLSKRLSCPEPTAAGRGCTGSLVVGSQSAGLCAGTAQTCSLKGVDGKIRRLRVPVTRSEFECANAPIGRVDAPTCGTYTRPGLESKGAMARAQSVPAI